LVGGSPSVFLRMPISAALFFAETVFTSLADMIICGETFLLARAAVVLEISVWLLVLVL
jgi:hypothetical protein